MCSASAGAARAAAGDVDVDVDAVACPSPSILSSCVILFEANFFLVLIIMERKEKRKCSNSNFSILILEKKQCKLRFCNRQFPSSFHRVSIQFTVC
jgi:hypothetical protein